MKYSQSNNPKRHKLMRTSGAIAGEIPMASVISEINSVEELKKYLQTAILIEHATMPPYLCALYSIKDGTNETAARIIRSVVVEEMLHMVMAANLLNAIGGTPQINTREAIPSYPTKLPASANHFEINLLKFSKEAIATFLKIEKPAVASSAPEPGKFNSIGQFYDALRRAFIRLDRSGTLFMGNPSLQVGPEHYYGSGGKLVPVFNLEDALLAIDEIVGQGEGIDGTIDDGDVGMFDSDVEYAHYFRFNELFHEQHYRSGDRPNLPPSGKKLKVDWNAVYNMEPNPKMDKYRHNRALFEKMTVFNKTYKALLTTIHQACNGQPEMLMQGLPLMYQLKEQAIELMKVPTGNGNYTAGPSFEYVD